MRQRLRHGLSHPAHPVGMMLGVALLAAAVTMSATVVHVDAALSRLVSGTASGLWLEAGFLASGLGATDLVVPLTAASALLLCALRYWRGALALVLAVPATQLVVDLIKTLVERPRPAANEALAAASGSSFPSAHSATAVALYATLTLVVAGACRGRARLGVVAAGTTVMAAVGISRVLVAAHYPIDVVAGWLTGAALVAASWLVAHRVLARPAAA
jgi:undecaprenyl-diphosphatase